MFGKAIGLSAAALVCCTVVAQADVFNMGTGLTNLETVSVGNPNNAGELSGNGVGGYGPDRICGAVGYTYNTGKFEVTAGQYTEFVSAVAKTDTFGLYNTNMWDSTYGCKIQQSGTSGNYTYSVASDYANRPVNYVSYWDSCRFANWLHNSQPTGEQGTGTTETGAYTLTSDGMNNNTVVRNTDWQWAITNEDEWYKAAYYKGGSTSAGYWDYPTGVDAPATPGRDMADASGNNANYAGTPVPIDSGKYTTLAGEFQDSDSPYGTFDQGGNVWEWNESILYGSSRGIRGSSWGGDTIRLAASCRIINSPPTGEAPDIGFRVASVPEPGSLAMLAGIALTALLYCWRKHV